MRKDREVACFICGDLFKTKLYNKKVCSKECSKARDVQYAKESYLRNKQDIISKCKVCKKEYKKINNSHTCSKKCSRKNSNRIKCDYAKRHPDKINKRLRDKRAICERLRERERESREKHKERRKLWEEENKDRLREYRKEYWSSEEGKAKRKEWREYKVQTDPLFRLRTNMSGLIREVMRKKGFSKKSKSTKILGCDYETLYVHLIKTFENNYKIEWKDEYYDIVHIDHIIPMSSAKNEEEVYKLNHFTNLQFLYWQDNLIKNDKIGWELALEDSGLFKEIEEIVCTNSR